MNQLGLRRSTSGDKNFQSHLKLLVSEPQSWLIRCYARKLWAHSSHLKIWQLLRTGDLYTFWVKRCRYVLFSHFTVFKCEPGSKGSVPHSEFCYLWGWKRQNCLTSWHFSSSGGRGDNVRNQGKDVRACYRWQVLWENTEAGRLDKVCWNR